MTLSLKQLVRRGFTTRQAQALIENTPEAPAAFPEHFANPTGDVAGLTAVVPLIGGAGDNDYYAGLVTIEAGTTLPPYVGVGSGREAGWNLFPADTAIVDSAIDDATTSYWPLPGHEHPPAGVYVAVYYSFAGLPAPTALPDGWTAGNTTGAGPALPLLGPNTPGDPSTNVWGGLVEVSADDEVTLPAGLWFAYQPNTPATIESFQHSPNYVAGPTLPKGVWMVFYQGFPGVVPTTFPSGWSFQPYGVGAAGPVLAALGETKLSPAVPVKSVRVPNSYRGQGTMEMAQTKHPDTVFAATVEGLEFPSVIVTSDAEIYLGDGTFDPVADLAGVNIFWRAPGRAKVTGQWCVDGGIGVGNSASATTPGTVVKKVEIFNQEGVSLGFIPVYDHIA